jgi:hypothetical protein
LAEHCGVVRTDVTIYGGMMIQTGKMITKETLAGKKCKNLETHTFALGTELEKMVKCKYLCYGDTKCSVWQADTNGDCFFGEGVSLDCDTTYDGAVDITSGEVIERRCAEPGENVCPGVTLAEAPKSELPLCGEGVGTPCKLVQDLPVCGPGVASPCKLTQDTTTLAPPKKLPICGPGVPTPCDLDEATTTAEPKVITVTKTKTLVKTKTKKILMPGDGLPAWWKTVAIIEALTILAALALILFLMSRKQPETYTPLPEVQPVDEPPPPAPITVTFLLEQPDTGRRETYIFKQKPIGIEFYRKLPLSIHFVEGHAKSLGVQPQWKILKVGDQDMSGFSNFDQAFAALAHQVGVLPLVGKAVTRRDSV